MVKSRTVEFQFKTIKVLIITNITLGMAVTYIFLILRSSKVNINNCRHAVVQIN